MKRALLFLLLATTAFAQNYKTPQEVFDAMHTAFRADRARGIHARYQFDLTGPNGGSWWIEVDDGACKMDRGTIARPDVVIRASDRDWVAISNDQLSGFWASVTGRLKISGNRGLARKLDEIFP